MFLDAFCIAVVAVVFAVVLVDSGMLLEPVQRWARGVYIRRQRSADPCGGMLRLLDEQWWFKPLWGCYKCVSGQWAFWLYLLLYHPTTWHLPLLGWLAFLGWWAVFVSATILFACVLNKLYQWSQN